MVTIRGDQQLFSGMLEEQEKHKPSWMITATPYHSPPDFYYFPASVLFLSQIIQENLYLTGSHE